MKKNRKKNYKVSLLIPTRNEEGCIGRVIQEVPKEWVDEILVIDGRSKDKTVKEAKEKMRPKKDRVIIQKGMGYGGAFIQGIKEAKGDIIIMMDADGSHDPADIPFLLRKIDEGYDYVMSSRYTAGGRSYDDTFVRWFGNQVFTKTTNFVHNMHVTDSLYLLTAAWKEDLLKLNLKMTGFEFCTEIVIKSARAGLRFAEVATIERARYAGNTHVFAPWHGLKILKAIFEKYD